MTRTIKASEVKPGMTIRWERYGFTHEGTVERVTSVGGGWMTRFLSGASGMSVQSDVEVTVLSEPAPPQPEEPTEFGAKVVAGGRLFLRAPQCSSDPAPWLRDSDGKRRNWAAIMAMGTVTVVPDQGWTAPDTPEVPGRIDEWDTWEDVPEGVEVENSGISPISGGVWGETSLPQGDFPGPWTRVTDA